MKPAALKQSSAPANIAADRIATWAFAKLTKDASAGIDNPFGNGTRSTLMADGTWQFNFSPQKKPRNSKPISEPIKIQRELKAISSQLRKDADFVTRYFSTSITAENLSKAIGGLTKLLVELAAKDARAVELLFLTAHDSVVGLENLETSADSLRLVQAVASKQPIWPVLYSPLPRNKRTLDKAMKNLGLAEHNFQKLKSARWSGNSLAGKFAYRVGSTLWKIHSDRLLRQCLVRTGVMPTQPVTKELIAQFGKDALKNLVVQTPDANSPELWERRLVAQGWRRWIVRLHQLPELTKSSAPAWFEVGWEALQDATGENVLAIREIAELGKTNAAYGARMGLKSGAQNSRAAEQSKKIIREAFLRRFGNPS